MSLSTSHEIKSRDERGNIISTLILNYSLHVGVKFNDYAILESVQIRNEVGYNNQVFEIDITDAQDKQKFKDMLELIVQCDVVDSIEPVITLNEMERVA